eukprot:gene1017-1290_t
MDPSQYYYGYGAPTTLMPTMPAQMGMYPAIPVTAQPITPQPAPVAEKREELKIDGPGLMNHQKEKYGAHLFAKNSEGLYTCFFANCGKSLLANFSRHISRHEQDGDPIDPNVTIKGTYVPPAQRQQQQQQTPSTPQHHGHHQQQIPTTPQHHHHHLPYGTPNLPTTPQHHQLPYMAPIPMQSFQFPMSMPMISSQNPLFAMSSPPQMSTLTSPPMTIQPPSMPITNVSANGAPITPIKQQNIVLNSNTGTATPTRAAATAAVTSANAVLNPGAPDASGIPLQTCQHPSHQKWWGTAPVLPQTEFYNRASKCKKCYIRQQQDAKRLRMHQGSTNVGHIMSTPQVSGMMVDDPILTPTKQTLIPTSSLMSPIGTPIKQQVSAGSLPLVIQQPTTPSLHQIQLQQYQNQQALISQHQQHQQHSVQHQQQVAAQQQRIQQIPIPKRDPTQQEIDQIMYEKCKQLITTIMKDPRTKPFRDDPVGKLHLNNYANIIKQPRDFGTIEKNLLNNKSYTVFSFQTDLKLVFQNAMQYNSEETDIYELAEELEKEYEEIFQKYLVEAETEATFQAELVKDQCAICKLGPIAYKKPPPPPELTENPTTPPPAQHDENIPTPLIICEGSCLRAFHLHCMMLPLDTKGPWMCNDCLHGRPILHFDPNKGEYFYFYYEGVSYEDEAANEELNSSVSSEDENENVQLVSNLGVLSKQEKIDLRKEEENHRVKEMYFDPVWCMWRCKSRIVMKQREERQNPVILSSQSKLKKRGPR